MPCIFDYHRLFSAGDQWFGEYQDANGLRLSGPLSRLMDFITNPDMARVMHKFLRSGGLRFVRVVLLCGSHVRLHGRLSLTGGLRLCTGGSHLRFIRTGGLRFVRLSYAASGFARPLPCGRLSFAALSCGFVRAALVCGFRFVRPLPVFVRAALICGFRTGGSHLRLSCAAFVRAALICGFRMPLGLNPKSKC